MAERDLSEGTPDDVPALLARYDAGVGLVEAALSGAADHDLDRRGPEAGSWSAREVVHHLADSETNSYVRLRRLLAEPPGTTIQGYDENAWARALAYDRPIDASLAVFRAVRSSSAELLGALLPTLPRAAWAVAGVHTDTGPYTLLDWLRSYAEHAEAHARQIRDALAG